MKTKFFITVIALGFIGITNIQAQDKMDHSGHDHAKMNKAETEVAYACPMKCEGDKTYDKKGSCPTCGMDLVKVEASAEVHAFQCPMKCEGEKTYDKKGSCPTCGMDLMEHKEKKDGHEGHGH